MCESAFSSGIEFLESFLGPDIEHAKLPGEVQDRVSIANVLAVRDRLPGALFIDAEIFVAHGALRNQEFFLEGILRAKGAPDGFRDLRPTGDKPVQPRPQGLRVGVGRLGMLDHGPEEGPEAPFELDRKSVV